MAVCPAGDAYIGPYLSDRKHYLKQVVKPLQDKKEMVFVVPRSDAEAHVSKRFPHKEIKLVGNGLRPRSVQNFLEALPLVFQRASSAALNACYHFTFIGEEDLKATVVIKNRSLEVMDGHVDTSDLHVTADARTWLDFLAKEKSLPMALISRKIRIKGSPKLMMAFAKCFPS